MDFSSLLNVGAQGLTAYKKGQTQRRFQDLALERQNEQDAMNQQIQQAQLDQMRAKAVPPPRNIDPLSPEGIAATSKLEELRAKSRQAPRDPVKDHAAMRDYDISHPLPTQEKPLRQEIPSESERKGLFFYQRAVPAGKIIDSFNDQKTLDALAAKAGMLGNWAKTPEGRRLIQAGKTWAMAVLRQDSGGAITDDEMEFYFDTYLPRPGDDAATLAQKAEARRVVTEGLKAVAGRAMPREATSGPSPALAQKPKAPPSQQQKDYDKAASALQAAGKTPDEIVATIGERP